MIACIAYRRAPASGAVAGPSTWNSRRLPCSATRCSTSACAPTSCPRPPRPPRAAPCRPRRPPRGPAWPAGPPPSADHALTDQQAVHLARQRQQAGLHRPVGRQPWCRCVVLAQEGDQQGPGELPDPRLDPAHHLVVEQQAHRLDVILVRLKPDVLHADKADHVLAVPGERLRGAVGHIAELLDRRAHPGPGGLPHRLLPVQDPGDGGDGDPRLVGDVIERNQAVTCPTCKRLQAAM